MAYLFCLFTSTKNISKLSVKEQGGYFDPFMADHYQNDKIKNIYGQGFLDVHKEGLKESIPDFYVNGQGRYFAALKEGINAAQKKHFSAKVALEKVSKKWEEITLSAGRESQIEQWSFLKASYPKNLKKVLK